MSRTKFDENRDQAIAREAAVDFDLLCRAHGCPNRWSVDGAMGKCCSAHAWAPQLDWPAITEQQQRLETDSAFQRARARSNPEPAPRLTREQKIELLQRMRAIFGPKQNPRQWAHNLREREMAGEVLSQAQREAWREALGARAHARLDEEAA